MTKTSMKGRLGKALACGCSLALAASLAPAAGLQAFAADADKNGIQDVPTDITFIVQQENASGGVTKLGIGELKAGDITTLADIDEFKGTCYADGKWGGVNVAANKGVSLSGLFTAAKAGGKSVKSYLTPNAKIEFESGYTNNRATLPEGITNFGPYEATWGDLQASTGFYGDTTVSEWKDALTSNNTPGPSIALNGETTFVPMKASETTTVEEAITANATESDPAKKVQSVKNSGYTLLLGVSPENAATATDAQEACAKTTNFVQGINKITVTLPYAPYEKTERVAGPEWADTMYDSVMAKYGKNTQVRNIVVATAVSYHDALAASGFAGAKSNAPILMTDQASLTAQTKKAITRLTSGLGADPDNPDNLNVYVIGGINAISNAVMDEIKAMPVFNKAGVNGKVTRLAGTEAWDTALEVFKAYSTGTNPGNDSWSKDSNMGPIVCTSKSYMDALSIAPYAYASKRPIILTNNDNVLTANAKNTVTTYYDGVNVGAVICGGPNAVSYGVQTQLASLNDATGKAIVRYAGYEWDETSNKIATALINGDTNLGSDFKGATAVGIATADDYYDALTAAAYCGQTGKCMPLVLVSSKQDNTYTIENFVSDFSTTAKPAGTLEKGVIFGGNVIIPDDIQQLAENALN